MTERSNNPKPKEKKAMKESVESMKNAAKIKEAEIPVNVKKEIIKDIEKEGVPESVAKKEEKIAEKTEKEAEKKIPQAPKKKDEAVVNAHSIPISTKTSRDICKFIKGKRISDAQEYLEQVMLGKKALPMKGEIPHRKGNMMSGGFPFEASKHFIVLLKSLSSNASANGIDEPVIVEAIPNMASRPFGRFGRVQKKRTHVRLVAREKKKIGGKK